MLRTFPAKVTAPALVAIWTATCLQAQERSLSEARTRATDPAKATSTQTKSAAHKFDKTETSIPSLLSSEVVKREIGISQQQEMAIDTISNLYGRQFPELGMRLRNASDPEEKAIVEAQIAEFQAELDDAIYTKLSRPQARRLTQIVAQNAGLRALTNPQVASAVGLSPFQQEAIVFALQRFDAEEQVMRAQFQERDSTDRAKIAHDDYESLAAFSRNKDRLDRIKTLNRSIQQARSKADREILKVMTKRQEKRFQQLLGRPVIEGDEGGAADQAGNRTGEEATAVRKEVERRP
ncbi:hypothetical protein EP7_002572 [Isosphaeraceae bacterium EP7]